MSSESQFKMVSAQAESFWKNYKRSLEWVVEHGGKVPSLPFEWMKQHASLDDDYHAFNTVPKGSGTRDEVNIAADSAVDDYGEVDEEYVRFIMETRKHQKERAKRKAKKAKKEAKIIYKDIEEVDLVRFQELVINKGTLNKDYEKLFGSGATKIRTLESSMVMELNEFYLSRKPKFWPNIPIKIDTRPKS